MKALIVKALPYVAIAALLLMAKCTYDGRRRAEGVLAIAIAEHRRTVDSLQKQQRQQDTQYIRDTVTRWRTVRSTVTLLDTLLHSDTVTLTRRESVIVFAADSAIQSCRLIVTACEARLLTRDSLLKAITWERDLWKQRSQPSWLTRTTTALKWAGVGYLIGRTVK